MSSGLVGLVSFKVVSLCLYALIPAFLPLTKAPLVRMHTSV